MTDTQNPESETKRVPKSEPPVPDRDEPEAKAVPPAPKPDPTRYGDWTVNGIAVDF